MEGAEGAVVLGDGLDRSQPLQVDHLSSTQEEADPLLQPVRLLLQAAVAGQLLKQLGTQAEEGSGDKQGHREHVTAGALQLHYFGPLVMDVHGSQHDVSGGIHPRLVSKHNSVSWRKGGGAG